MTVERKQTTFAFNETLEEKLRNVYGEEWDTLPPEYRKKKMWKFYVAETAAQIVEGLFPVSEGRANFLLLASIRPYFHHDGVILLPKPTSYNQVCLEEILSGVSRALENTNTKLFRIGFGGKHTRTGEDAFALVWVYNADKFNPNTSLGKLTLFLDLTRHWGTKSALF